MKKLLVLGAPEFQIPLLMQARRMGLYTYVLDLNSMARGVAYADEFIQCDLKDKEGALAIAKRIMPDGVTVGMCDVAVNSAALICSTLHLPGLDIETAKKATDKYLMIQEFEKCNVPHPWFKRLNLSEIPKLKYDFSFPIISKPIDMAGSRGINKIISKDDAEMLLFNSAECSDCKEIIIEEFLEGPEVSVEILVKEHVPYVLQITDKYTSGAPHFVELGHTQPSILPNDVKCAISEVAKNAVRALGLYNCFAHAEIIISNEGPKMVEIGARMGGDSIQEQLIMYSKSINIPYYSIMMALGEDYKLPDMTHNMCSTIRFLTSSKRGVVKEIYSVDEARKIKNIMQIEVFCQNGDIVDIPIDSSGRLGYVISQAKTVEESILACSRATELIKIVIEDE